jgi:hypothetical protein
VCLLYQEIKLSCECVFIVSGDRAILCMCVHIHKIVLSADTINTHSQDSSPDTINTHTQDSSPDTINTHTTILGMCVYCMRR